MGANTYGYDNNGNQTWKNVERITLNVERYYEWTGSTSTMKRYYYAGGTRVVMRTGSSTLNYLLGDHLGSQSITANSSGVRVAEERYMPWGESRYTYGTTPTTYRFTGQRGEAGLGPAGGEGLMYYGVRWYDGALGRFISADTVVPGAGNSQAYDRYAYTLNNPIKYIDPSGHRTCSAQQAATGDETCDQNMGAEQLEILLNFSYGWKVKGDWSKGNLLILLGVGKNIRRHVAELTGRDDNSWTKMYLGNAVFHMGSFANDLNRTLGARGVTLWKSNIYLPSIFDAPTVAHELAHVLENNLGGSSFFWPATYIGGGAADAMVQFLGGNPAACFPRFICLSPQEYVLKVAGRDPWPVENTVSNNGVADDFAEIFSWAVYNPSIVPANRLLWMNVLISLMVNKLP